jgi:hypothetical protein
MYRPAEIDPEIGEPRVSVAPPRPALCDRETTPQSPSGAGTDQDYNPERWVA